MENGKNKVLSNALPGDVMRVERIGASTEISQRLGEMGIVRGSKIKMIKFAPLGDPMELQVGRYRLALRKDDASGVEVLSIAEVR
ncbi:MAG: ferrous iron transport protein A [Planctomycetes bacterium]|nr:ferrous iron transport protein A [Planctomycetota bacterium]